MKIIRIAFVAVVVVLFSVTTVAAQIGSPDSRPTEPTASDDIESADLPVYGVISEGGSLNPELPPTPVPVVPPTGLTGTAEAWEFVGVTNRYLAGNRGVLNYTLECQAQFPGSRMCFVEELLRTRNVPRRLADSYAWIQPDSSLSETTTCKGWMSGLNTDTGLAIAIDPTCYAGFVQKSCDSRLAVACCAPVPRE